MRPLLGVHVGEATNPGSPDDCASRRHRTLHALAQMGQSRPSAPFVSDGKTLSDPAPPRDDLPSARPKAPPPAPPGDAHPSHPTVPDHTTPGCSSASDCSRGRCDARSRPLRGEIKSRNPPEGSSRNPSVPHWQRCTSAERPMLLAVCAPYTPRRRWPPHQRSRTGLACAVRRDAFCKACSCPAPRPQHPARHVVAPYTC